MTLATDVDFGHLAGSLGDVIRGAMATGQATAGGKGPEPWQSITFASVVGLLTVVLGRPPTDDETAAVFRYDRG